jgi:putative FmdB family regulatory protein
VGRESILGERLGEGAGGVGDNGAVPIYEYRCANGHTFEVIHSMSDDPVDACEECGAAVERVFHPVAVHFKGSGFYTTDYAKKGSGKAASDGGSKADDGGSKGSNGSETKSESGTKSEKPSGDKKKSGD